MDVGAHGAALLVLTNNSASSNVVSFSFSSGYRVQVTSKFLHVSVFSPLFFILGIGLLHYS